MDASALLVRQGWRGTGHSLDTTDRGIKKPLLISHKRDTLGLGKKKAAHNVDDQWWMRAFDESLRNIGSGQESTLAQVRKQGINRGGLYGFFVKGEGLAGTIFNSSEETMTAMVRTAASSSTSQSSAEASRESTPPTSVDGAGQAKSKKRKREDKAVQKEDRKRRKEEKRAAKSSSSGKSRERKLDSRATETVEIHVEEAQVAVASVERKVRRENKRKGKDIDGEVQVSGKLDTSEGSSTAGKSDKKKKRKKDSAIEEEEDSGLSPEVSKAVTAKLSKLTPDEKAQYEERARSKKQTLEQYVLRRIQKKDEKKKDVSSAEVKIEKRRKGRELVVKSERVRVVEVAA